MANDFFDAGDYTELTAHTLARANSVNAIFGALVTGFDRLPPKLLLDQDRVTYATEGGGSAANVYVYTLPKTLVAYTEGLTVKFKTTHVNTGASTINIDALGAKAILRGDGTALVAGDIPSGAFMMIGYDGSAFRVLSGAASLSDLTAHAALTAAHGATGAVVGTTNSQTLTNKTLTSPAGPAGLGRHLECGACRHRHDAGQHPRHHADAERLLHRSPAERERRSVRAGDLAREERPRHTRRIFPPRRELHPTLLLRPC
jgi:hypothetical protein